MKKFYSLLLLFASTAAGAMAQTQTYAYEPKDVLTDEWSWSAETPVSQTNDTKDVVIRNNNHKAFFVGATTSELNVNNGQGQQYKFRFIKTSTANRYKIYAVDAQKFVKWTRSNRVGHITELVDEKNANDWLVVYNNGANTYNGAFDIIAGNVNYSDVATCWNPHGGMGANRAIGGWYANDPNSAWQICKEYNNGVELTYNLQYKGETKQTVKVAGVPGHPFPPYEDALPVQCHAVYPEGPVNNAGTYSVDIKLDQDYPFVPVANYTQDSNWYTLTIRGKHISYNRANQQLERSDNAPENYTDVHFFQFQGNPFDGYKILNRAAGNGKAAGSTSVADKVILTMMEEGQARTYLLTSGFHFKEKTTTNGYLNDNSGVSYWINGAAANDEGGKFTFTQVDVNDHLLGYKNKKAELQNFLNNTSVTAILNPNAHGRVQYELSEYNPDNSTVGNTEGLAKIDEWYNSLYSTIDNQIVLQSPERNGKYAYVNLNGNTVLKDTKNEEAVFQVKGSSTDRTITFTHACSTRKLDRVRNLHTPVKANLNESTEQGKFTLKLFDGNTDQVAFICTQPANSQHNSLHADGYSQVVPWEAKNIGGSTWKVEKVDYTNDQLIAAAKQRLKEAEGIHPIGVHLGQYFPEDFDKYLAAKQSKECATIEEGVVQVMNATLNMPLKDEFFRIKTKDGQKYISANHKNNRLSIVDSADENTLFYFDENKKLVSVAQSKAVGLTTNFAAMQDYNNEGQNVEFNASTATNTPSLYRINIGERAFYADASKDVTDAGNKNTDNKEGYRFQLESVTDLHIAIGEIGYATFFTPVEANLQQAEAYQAKKEGEKLVLKLISGTIPANTAFIIKGSSNGNAILSIKEDIYDESGHLVETPALIGNALTGYAVTPTTPVSGETVYALTKGDDNQPIFAKLANGVYKRAFRAFLPAAAGGAQALEFDFGHVTGLEALGTAVHETPVYDLSGRRVLVPAQGGVYLQNGKKFIQK